MDRRIRQIQLNKPVFTRRNRNWGAVSIFIFKSIYELIHLPGIKPVKNKLDFPNASEGASSY